MINENSKKYYNENLDKMKTKHNEYYLQTKNEKLKNMKTIKKV